MAWRPMVRSRKWVTPDYMRTLIKPGPNLSREHREAVFWHLMQPYGQNFHIIMTQVLLALLCLFSSW